MLSQVHDLTESRVWSAGAVATGCIEWCLIPKAAETGTFNRDAISRGERRHLVRRSVRQTGGASVGEFGACEGNFGLVTDSRERCCVTPTNKGEECGRIVAIAHKWP
jgi:hypothetical protein